MSNPRTTIFLKPDQMPDSLPGRKNKSRKILEPNIYLSDSELLIFMKRGVVEAFNILVERWRKKLIVSRVSLNEFIYKHAGL